MEQQGSLGSGASTPFSDLAASPYREAVAQVYQRGWLLGISATCFAPDNPLERGMLAAVLYRVAGCPEPPRRGYFVDVPCRAYYAPGVDWGASRGLFLGVGNRRFAPGRPTSWQELALVLWRWVGSPRQIPSPEAAPWAGAGVAWAREQTAFPVFSPEAAITRGEAAQLLLAFFAP